jgi:lysophospholipase L1-like esterase
VLDAPNSLRAGPPDLALGRGRFSFGSNLGKRVVARTMSLTALIAVVGAGCVVVAVIAGFAVRHAWIERKIAALTSPPTRIFSKENAALPPKEGRRRVVLIGDSGISRWPMERLSERWQFVNRGVGGETVGQVAQRFEADALSLDPDLIVLGVGGNDLIAADFLDPVARRAVIDRTCETLEDLSRRATERGIPVLIATLAPPSSPDILRLPVWRESVRDSVAEVNQRLRRYGSQSGVDIVDFSAALGADDRRTPDKFRADTLHLNSLGYDRLTNALYRALDGFENRLH